MTTSQAPVWTAIVLAGQRPGPDPLASHFGEQYKALVPVGGVPMIERVVGCLLRVPQIVKIIILAQDPQAVMQRTGGWPGQEERIATVASGSGIAASIAAVLNTPSPHWPVLVTTADHALLTPEMVEEFLAGAGEGDLSVGAVERRTILSRYPDTVRTWLKFADGAYSGANLFALRTERARRALDLWSSAERDRKRAFKLFWHFGPLLAFRAIFRLVGFRQAIALAGQRLGIDARLVELSIPEAAIDVDKVSDHILVERIVAGRD